MLHAPKYLILPSVPAFNTQKFCLSKRKKWCKLGSTGYANSNSYLLYIPDTTPNYLDNPTDCDVNAAMLCNQTLNRVTCSQRNKGYVPSPPAPGSDSVVFANPGIDTNHQF